MQLCAVLILLVTLSAACGLRCYTCTATQAASCTDTKSCPVVFNRCFSHKVKGVDVVTKGCQNSSLCVDGMSCCEGDLCNNATANGSSSMDQRLSLFPPSSNLDFNLGLRCYSCVGEICAETTTCPAGTDRCATVTVAGVASKTCMIQALCIYPVKCCNTDLCNSALPTGPSSVVLLLLVTSAIITLFL